MFKDYENETNSVISIQNDNLYKNIISIGINNCESILLSVNSQEIEYSIIDRLKHGEIIYLLGIDFYSQEDDDLILIEISDIEIKIFSDNENISKFFQLKEEYDDQLETIGKLEFKEKIYIVNYKNFEVYSDCIENSYVNLIINSIKALNIINPELN